MSDDGHEDVRENIMRRDCGPDRDRQGHERNLERDG